MLPFPALLQMPYLQTRNHGACVQLIHFPSNSRSNTEVGCKFNYSTCTEQKQNLIVKFVLLCWKIKNKRSWSGLCDQNAFQFIKPWGNEIKTPEGFFLPHGVIISQCFFSEIFAPQLCTPKETSIPFSGAWISSNNLQFLQIIPFKHLMFQPTQTIFLFKLIWDKNGGIIN